MRESLKKAICLDFERAKEKAMVVRDVNKYNLLIMEFTYRIFGDTGITYDVNLIVKGLPPHEDYPNHFLVIGYRRDGKGTTKYSRDCERKEGNLFEELKLSLPAVTLETGGLVGVYRQKEGEKGKQIARYYPYLFEPETISAKPVATEMFENLLNDIKYNKAMDIQEKGGKRKYNYFKIGDEYYEGIGDPLQEAMEGSIANLKERFVSRLNQQIPTWGDLEDMEFIFPTYFYKGYIPLNKFGKELNFNPKLMDMIRSLGTKIILPEWSKVNLGRYDAYTPYKTFKEFEYAYKEHQRSQKFFDALHVSCETLIGEELEVFDVGTRVCVVAPTENHEVLRSIEGVVRGKDGAKIIVEFLNFQNFKEPFATKELQKLSQ